MWWKKGSRGNCQKSKSKSKSSKSTPERRRFKGKKKPRARIVRARITTAAAEQNVLALTGKTKYHTGNDLYHWSQ